MHPLRFHLWTKGFDPQGTRIQKPVGDRPDLSADEESAAFVADDPDPAWATGKTPLCKLDRQVRIGKAEAEEVRCRRAGGTAGRDILDPTQVVPGPELAAGNIKHKDELRTMHGK